MSDHFSNDEDSGSLEQLESLIRAAGGYVRPSEDLRPRTLEAAREYCSDRRSERKLGGFAIAVLLMVTFSSPAIQCIDMFRSSTSAPSATEMQQRAIEYGAQPQVGRNWGLAEAFTQLRRVQAARLSHSNRLIK